jgi:hypothetical protein
MRCNVICMPEIELASKFSTIFLTIAILDLDYRLLKVKTLLTFITKEKFNDNCLQFIIVLNIIFFEIFLIHLV